MLFQIRLALTQEEWTQINAVSDTVVETALIVLKFVFHPAGGTAAGNQHNIVAPLYPRRPKIFQFIDKFAALGVYPGHFVEENDFTVFRAGRQVGCQRQECVVPILKGFYVLLLGIPHQCLAKIA